jgi:uncharacterized protein (DUF1697 family)
VKTLLSSGNVVFDARATSEAVLERKAVAAMEAGLGRSFAVILRKQAELQQLLAGDPFAAFKLTPQHKRVVTLPARRTAGKLALPPEKDGARILAVRGAARSSVLMWRATRARCS